MLFILIFLLLARFRNSTPLKIRKVIRLVLIILVKMKYVLLVINSS